MGEDWAEILALAGGLIVVLALGALALILTARDRGDDPP